MSNNRTSIFEAFNMPTMSVPQRPPALQKVRYTENEVLNQITILDDSNSCDVDAMFNDVEEVEDENQNNQTLWMSCSPGRDSAVEDEDLAETSVIYESLDVADSVETERLIPIETLDDLPFDEEEVVISKKVKKKSDNSNTSISSYGLFFRDTQIAIKEQNPSASFGEIAKVVANMWDNLNESHKQYYNKLAEDAKQQDKKKLKMHNKEQDILKNKEKTKKLPKERKNNPEKSDASSKSIKQSPMKTSSAKTATNNQMKQPSVPMCSRSGCTNKAINDIRWNFDYCSSQCVVSHMRDVFKAFVASRKSTAQETNVKK